ncbi:MAG: ribosome small subunit-dependent GTPase A, partial [Chloroflexota bacterium]|nr:ribosome small subunit-dependent GTPase A [Chloroflexota bacterium]
VILCVNKADQGIAEWVAARLAVYAALGYAVVTSSAVTGEGVEQLRGLLSGRVSALMGPSGVGKSSLLNALEPGLALRVSAVSATTGKGRHTTTGARLAPLSGSPGGWIADTAGIRALGLEAAALADLPRHFREFRPLLGRCAFADCAHLSEPGCAVIAATQAGDLDAARYDSYRRLALGDAYAGALVGANPQDADDLLDEETDWDAWDGPGARGEAWNDHDG